MGAFYPAYWLLPLLVLVAAIGFAGGRQRALVLVRDGARLHSRPSYHGGLVALVALIAALACYLGMRVGLKDNGAWSLSVAAFASVIAGVLAWQQITSSLRARVLVERFVMTVLFGAAALSVLITFAIVLSVLFESLRFFDQVPLVNFLFGVNWSPQQAEHAGLANSFGVVPLLLGTLMIMAIALLVAVPLGLFCAVYLAEYASSATRTWVKPALELLAGIPTVIYGYFAIITISPLLRRGGEALGIPVAAESALATGLVMGIMIIPYISSLSDDILRAVPVRLREASLGLGATPAETIRKVVLPAALPGVVGAILLAVSRAIGETMIVVMAAGLSANLTTNPLEAVTTVTVQIVTLLTGDQEFDSPKTLAAFALGLTLFVVTLLLNIVALRIVRKYREQYE